MTGESQTSKISENEPTLSDEDKSKDDFFERTAHIAEEMKTKHGKDFAIGVFVLAARFLAEGKSLKRPDKN